MGGMLGSRVTALLEDQPWVADVVGVDIDPPRKRLRHARFHRIDPRDRRRVVSLVRDVQPEVVLHLGIWEPNARVSSTAVANELTTATAVSVLGAAAECPSLEAIVVRSGIEVYGRGRGAPTLPDESVPVAPTSSFGRSLVDAEAIARAAGRAAGVPVTMVRLAPVVGPHIPSPLGRLLRLPVVPVGLLADAPFSLVHQDDAARALVAAARARLDEPVNVVGAGAVTAMQAARIGGRLPVPVVGPEWWFARRIADLMGAPVPDHLLELLRRGRSADGARAPELLGVSPAMTTLDVVRQLYAWASVTPLRPAERGAA
jgi:UDP-glucose 4-epimerase